MQVLQAGSKLENKTTKGLLCLILIWRMALSGVKSVIFLLL
ncbi:MAG: hypothetical protein OFPI_11470 [Osedax symbiont Rs2]|nr:MAG: hypothetical protein OFPI_11470 [Osedax symbiont Rs2]